MQRELSTIVACLKCKVENKINEIMEEVENGYLHLRCVSDDEKEKDAGTVVELLVNDDLSVKSEGR